MVSVALCPAEQVDLFWSSIEPLLMESSKYSKGRHDAEDLYWQIANEKVQLWVIAADREIVAACVSGINNYPGRPMLNVPFLGGSRMKEWLPQLIDKLKRFAVFNSLEGIEMVGRPGWEKILGSFSFTKAKAIFMELDFNGR